MRASLKLIAATAVIAGLAFALPAGAHGIWFAQRATQLALMYGVGADDLDAVRRLPPTYSAPPKILTPP